MVAASEWFVFNKTIGIPLFPSKLLLAAWLSKQWEHYKQQYELPCLLSTSTTTATPYEKSNPCYSSNNDDDDDDDESNEEEEELS